MAVYANDDIMDAALNLVKNNASKIILLSGDPGTSYSNATTLTSSGGNKIGEAAVASGDFTLADGNTSGRRVTCAQQTGVAVDGSLGTGLTWDHVAIVDDTNTRLLLVTPLSSAQTVDGGQTVTVNAFDEEIADAA